MRFVTHHTKGSRRLEYIFHFTVQNNLLFTHKFYLSHSMQVFLALFALPIFGPELLHDILVDLCVGVDERDPPLLLFGLGLLVLLLLDACLVHQEGCVQDHKSKQKFKL